ncbi:MAG: hypothetical protein JXB32_08070 [Deltaproteobacteria bacterium]|nr:hypothetical protein [Deltaproteobacteria bacterium]
MRRIGLGVCITGLALGLAFACGDDDNGNPDVGDTDGETAGGCTRTDECPHGMVCESGVCELRLPTLVETGADMTCLGNNPRPDPLGTTVTATMYVEDFEDEYLVEGVTLELFFDNVVDETPDQTVGPTNASGEATGATGLPARGVIAYRATGGTSPTTGAAQRTTIEYDVEIPDADGGRVRALSISDSTYRLIPTILGITPDASHAIIAGAFEDCATDEVEGIVARLLNASGADCHVLDPRECYSRYFVDEFPSRIDNQPHSSPDGLYAIAQVPPGDWTMEVRGRLTAATTEYPYDLLGEKTVHAIADAIVIVDVNPLAEPAD